jgi:hypothetical protein
MNAITDEMLMAYADGMLSQAEMRRVATALEEAPYLVERLEAFRCTQDRLRQPFASILALPIPQRLLSTVIGPSHGNVKQATVHAKRSLRAHLSAFLDNSRAGSQRRLGGYFAPGLAMSAVLVLGLAAGWLLHARQFDAHDGVPFHVWGVTASKFMQDALDKNVGGETATVAGENSLSLTPVASFRSKDGEWCRSYEKTTVETKEKVVGLACRTTSGPWRVKTEVAALASFYAVGDKTQPPEATASLNSIAGQFMVGPELGRDEEARQIAVQWGAMPPR